MNRVKIHGRLRSTRERLKLPPANEAELVHKQGHRVQKTKPTVKGGVEISLLLVGVSAVAFYDLMKVPHQRSHINLPHYLRGQITQINAF